MVRKLAILTIASLAYAVPASAQLCSGQPSFASGPVQVTPGAIFAEGYQGFGAGVTGGSDRFFAGGSILGANYSDIEEGSLTLGAHGGGTFAADTQKRVYLCPTAGFSWQTGPNFEDGLEVRNLSFSGGGNVGIVATDNGRLAVVPTVGASVVRMRTKVSAFDLINETVTDTFGVVNAGVGFVFNQRMALTPSVSFPVGLEGSDPQFNVVFAINFGR